MEGVTVAYSGVHAIYQIALAAHEIGRLDRLYCSLIDAPGKWGRALARVVGADALTSRRCLGLPPALVREYPWPFVLHRIRSRWRPGRANDWFDANDRFDRHVARLLGRSGSRVFVGAETCAEHCLRTAKARGMATVLDCEQVHPVFLWSLLARAADDLGLPPPAPVDTPRMAARKEAEFHLADTIIVLSEVERRSFLEQGLPAEKLVEIPLWVDPELWLLAATPLPTSTGPLRVLFVGSIDLRKGIPYLLQAVRQCGRGVELTLVGSRNPELEPVLAKHAADFRYVPPQSKVQLRATYQRSDVLVLPSLVDTFGFVALEAMACGIPVVVSENCGVPVPDPSWRIPIMNAEAIAERLMFYVQDRPKVREHGEIAARFASGHTPESYRRKVIALFDRLLNAGSTEIR